ncbi:MAG: formate-dependent phosphoribosylglycinamide formyltransferase [Euryarchaeota archaeon]|nr:formate-dependent phosphoribosylglycinamide formyltransferase [Euryarchaeota archaeon]
MQPRKELGTPLFPGATRLLLLGSGEIGREVALEAMRMGAEVVAVDRYANAPAMQVAHRHHVLSMTDGKALRALIEREAPDVIVPEIEQINTSELLELEREGWTVVPRADATFATMDRERIRRLAAEKASVPTSRYAFVDSAEEAHRAVKELGLPAVFKAMMSSSGLGSTVVHRSEEVGEAYRRGREEGRVVNPRVMVEEFLKFDLEITLLTLRHYGNDGRVTTSFCPPIAHVRPGTHYHESWQPAELAPRVISRAQDIAKAVTDQLGGIGIFGCEQFIRGNDVFFSEISPRPHDTGLVTLATQWQSEFALHARAILGFPIPSIELVSPGAAHVILAPAEGWGPRFGGLWEANRVPGVRVHLFGKPSAYPERRMGIALAQAPTVAEARRKAEEAAHTVEGGLYFPSRSPPPA